MCVAPGFCEPFKVSLLPTKNQDRKLSQLRVTSDNRLLTLNMVVVFLFIIGVSLACAQGDAPGESSFIKIDHYVVLLLFKLCNWSPAVSF